MQRSFVFSSVFVLCAGLLQFACMQDFDQFTPNAGSGGSGATGGSATGGTGGEAGAGGGASSSSSAASSSSSSSGTIMCTKNPDCPMSNQCEKWACDMTTNVCVQTFTTAGTPIVGGSDPAGNCKIEVCNGAGQSTIENDDMDTPMDDGNPCTIEACTNGTPSTMNASTGAACPGGKCDANATCVECLADGDCSTGTNPSCDMASNQCISCSDGTQNGDEEGVDCGGTKCAKKCGGATCADNMECLSGFCADGVCCNNACNTTCKACNIAGSEGTCSNIAFGMPDATPVCDNTQACDGNGACKLKNGEVCTNDASCLSNNCVNGSTKLCQP